MLRHVCLFQMFLGNNIYVFRDVMLIIYAYSRKTKFVNHFQESWTYHIAAQHSISYAKRNRFFCPMLCVLICQYSSTNCAVFSSPLANTTYTVGIGNISFIIV